jgi:hypothetical protein
MTKLGEYLLTYTVSDAAADFSVAVRKVVVVSDTLSAIGIGY